MKITEVLRKEKGNTGVILHKEGMFWRAYEMSANLFVEQIKKYEVKTKYYKKVKQEVMYIGFPDSVLKGFYDICKSKQLVFLNGLC